MEALYLTIPHLARLLEVTPPTIRHWIKAGWIKAPERIGPSETLAYPQGDADAIKQWYLQYAAKGLCRGIGADEKRRRALAALAQSDESVAMKAERLSSNERTVRHESATHLRFVEDFLCRPLTMYGDSADFARLTTHRAIDSSQNSGH